MSGSSHSKENTKPNGGSAWDVLVILASALKKRPYVAAIVLVFALLVYFVTSYESLVKVLMVIGVAILIIVLLFYLELKDDQTKIETLPDSPQVQAVDLNNTIQLVSSLSASRRDHIRTILINVVEEAAEAIKVPVDAVRANIFGTDGTSRLRMARDLIYHMDQKEELTVSMPIGYGSTGRCYSGCKPNIAIFPWGESALEPAEAKKVHPDLKWIISVPVFLSESSIQPVCIMNVDGLNVVRTEDELKGAIRHILRWGEMVHLALADAVTERGVAK